ncbi:anti-sigma factor family protein [Ensifer adhaerens]|uniref:anti-sigma factor family protein n=1 Tax=Ensifer adhaerens TaxID=106592 RepID=UPI00099019E8|nr:zf-HC2 domain-containing protein [Ensifer adhaerens]
MSDTEFSDEILMAFADGELDEETTRRVEAALETDDELMARVAMFMETRAAASDALKPVLDEPVPDELVAKVRAMAAAQSGAERAADAPATGGDNVVAFRRPQDQPASPRGPSRLLMAMAASLLVVVGGAGGYLLRGGGLVDTGAMQVAGTVGPVLSAILNEAASGEEVAVGAGQGTVRLVSAFELGSGQLCREYELTQPGEPGLVSVACRKTNVWQTRLAVAKPEGGDGYAPASSLETVDAFLTSIGAGQPLDADAEKKALAASK